MADTLSDDLIESTAAMMVLTTVVMSVRVGVRASSRTFGIDDILVTASWGFLMAMCTIVLVSTTHAGFGNHSNDVSPEDHVNFIKLSIPISSTYSYGLALAKMSFAVLYIRMLPGRKLLILNKAIVVFLCCQAVQESLIPIFQCRPIAKAWTPRLPGQCIDLPVLWWCGFGFNLCTDLILFIQPMPTLWKLQLPLVKRLGLIAMLSLGLMVCAISVIRMHAVTEMGLDDTHDLAVPVIWSEAEVSTLILCSCVPSLRKLALKVPWLRRIFETASDDQQGPTIQTIGQVRKKKKKSGSDGLGQESDLTESRLTYPMSVLSRSGKPSATTANGDTASILRTKTGVPDDSSSPNDIVQDLEAQSDVIQTPIQVHFPSASDSSPLADDSEKAEGVT